MSHASHIEHQAEMDAMDVFGFWLYILTDCIIFASLFATFIVLNHPGAFGPALSEHINLNFVLVESLLLLGSNFTFGLSMLALNRGKTHAVIRWLGATFILGASFVSMELYEFFELAHHGYSWHVSGAASAFFTLVGTHGLHVSAGLVWILVTMLQLHYFGINVQLKKRMVQLGLFWNFLDIVWIFVFSVVYLMGAL